MDKLISQMFNDGVSLSGSAPPSFYGEGHYTDFLSKRVQLKNYTWLATVPHRNRTTHSTDLFADYRAAASNKTLWSKLSNQSYFRGNMKITITLQGAPQAYGQMVFCAMPTSRYQDDTAPTSTSYTSMVRAKSLPHVVMDPSTNCICEFEIPCASPEGVWYDEDQHSWALYAFVYNELESGTATEVTELQGTIYLSFDDLDPGPMTMLSETIQEQEEKGGPFSGPASAVAKAADTLSSVPMIGPYMTVTSNVAGTAARFLKWMGFSRPYESNPNQVVVNKTTTTYGTVNTKSYHTPLATDGANAISASPTYYGGGDIKDMDISHICSMPSLVHTVKFLPTTPVGLIASIDVSPVKSIQSTNTTELSNLAYMALPFKYWHGEITYTIEVVCSAFHRTVLGVAHTPTGTLTDWQKAVQTVRTQIITVSGNTTFEMTVPWQQIKPFGEVSGLDDFSVGSNGTLGIFLIAPLESNGSTAGVRINVYAHSNNMNFMLPTTAAIQHRTFVMDDLTPLSEPVLTYCSEGCEMAGTVVLDSFGEDSTKDIFLRFGGEDIATTTKKVASKLSLSRDLTGADSFHTPAFEGGTFDYEINFLPQTTYRTPGAPVSYHNSFFDYYGAGYMGTRGTVNMSMVPLRGSMTNTGINFFWLTTDSKDQSKPVSTDSVTPFGTNISIGYPEIHPTNDVSVPHYVNGYFRPSSTPSTLPSAGASFGHEGLNGEFFFLKSLGDDGVYVKYLGPPTLLT